MPVSGPRLSRASVTTTASYEHTMPDAFVTMMILGNTPRSARRTCSIRGIPSRVRNALSLPMRRLSPPESTMPVMFKITAFTEVSTRNLSVFQRKTAYKRNSEEPLTLGRDIHDLLACKWFSERCLKKRSCFLQSFILLVTILSCSPQTVCPSPPEVDRIQPITSLLFFGCAEILNL